MLRRRGFTGSVTVVDQEPDSPYDRPNLSKDFLAGTAAEEWIPLRADGFYAEHGIQIVRARATRLNVGKRHLELEGRAPLPFDALLLATGADPIRLPVPGGDLAIVHYLRSLAESRAIIAAASNAKRAVVIGGSFGRPPRPRQSWPDFRGLDVGGVVALWKLQPLERVLGAGLGAFIKALHEEKGVVFHLGRKPASVEPAAVLLDDGTAPRRGDLLATAFAW